jgi:glycosyltransferase involved in cell wall biosynthesis
MDYAKTEKKHIAMYIGSLQKGGAERVMVNLAEYFWSRGYHVTLVTTYIASTEYEVPHAAWKVIEKSSDNEQGSDVFNADSSSRIANEGVVDAVVVDKPGQLQNVDLHGGLEGGIDRVFTAIDDTGLGRAKAFAMRFKTLQNVWKQINPDLILSFIGKNNIMSIMTAKSLHIPVVVSVRAKFEMEYPSKSMMIAMKYTFPKAAGIVLQSRGAASILSDRLKKKVTVLPNSINPVFIRKTCQGDRDKTIVTVGRIDENKNHKLIIDSLAKIKDEYPEYKLHIYGDGPDRNKLKSYVDGKGLSDRVIFEGSVSDVADRIERAGMFILSSDMEGMPNALIEAMSLGLPCITTDCMYDTSELIQNDINGIVVPKGDIASMSEAMKRLIEDTEYATRLGSKASEIQKEVSPDVINRKWEDYIIKLVCQKED